MLVEKLVKENTEKKQIELRNAALLMFSFAVLKKLWRTFYPSPQSGTMEISQAVVTSLCVAVPGVCSHWADGAFFFFISTRGSAVIHPPPPISFFFLHFPTPFQLSSLLWESTHNALWGNSPIMNTTLLNLNGASGSGQIGRWNIHKALITLLFLADALCALTVGDNHAVPLGLWQIINYQDSGTPLLSVYI